MKYTRLNDYTLHKLEIHPLGMDEDVAIDLRAVFAKIFIYEDLFSNVITANIILEDANDLITKIPILGSQEVVTIELSIANGPITKYKFLTHSIPRRIKSQNANIQTYSLSLVSPEFLRDITQKVNRSYEGKITDIVQMVYGEFLFSDKELIVDEPSTNTIKKFVVPRKSPFQTINWLLRRAIPMRDPASCNYIMYQAKEEGQINFKVTTISNLLQKDPFLTYFYAANKSANNPLLGEDISFNSTNIYDIEYESDGDRFHDIMNGRYASKIITVDPVSNRHRELSFEIPSGSSSTIENSSQVSSEIESMYSMFPDSYISVKPRHTYLYDDIEDNDEHEYWLLRRRSLMLGYNSKRIIFQVPGDNRLSVGMVIDLFIPPPDYRENQSLREGFDSGKYLVGEIKHEIERTGYLMTVKAIRDSNIKEY